jgi:hypothetical protein
MSTNAQVQKSITAPDSFDIGGSTTTRCSRSGRPATSSRSTAKITSWNDYYPVFTTCKVNPVTRSATAGQGDAPLPRPLPRSRQVDGAFPDERRADEQQADRPWWDGVEEMRRTREGTAEVILGPPAHFKTWTLDGYNGERHQEGPNQVHWRAPEPGPGRARSHC